jgi:hypothetical protein
VDFGVVIFSPLDAVKESFGRYNVRLLTLGSGALGGIVAPTDFATGQTFPVPVDVAAAETTVIGEALQRYDQELARYPGLTNTWNLTYHVDEDWMVKKDLTALAPIVFSINQGVGDMLNALILNVLRYFDAGWRIPGA